jgi:hypothetical protein
MAVLPGAEIVPLMVNSLLLLSVGPRSQPIMTTDAIVRIPIQMYDNVCFIS